MGELEHQTRDGRTVRVLSRWQRGYANGAYQEVLESNTDITRQTGMDGFALLKTVRTTFAPEQLPAVAITAFSRAEDRLRAVEAGFQGYIMKPYDIGELITLIRDVSATQAAERRSPDSAEMVSRSAIPASASG
jgi:PleD family two-component response regulator